ncbi:MAG TPA: hypothetical protein VHA14_16365, partial [Bryobacteraceae bacterium]|nr:hypothetical protein [Bryobacteraceae bacterium]
LVISAQLISAQLATAPLANVTIRPIVHEVKFCLGPVSYFPSPHQPEASDIAVKVSLKLLYENRGRVPIIVPLRFRSSVRMAVAGREGSSIVSSQTDPWDTEGVRDLVRPEPPDFLVIRRANLMWLTSARPFGSLSSPRMRNCLARLWCFPLPEIMVFFRPP